MNCDERPVIAYGVGTLLELWRYHHPNVPIRYAVDRTIEKSTCNEINDLDVYSPTKLFTEFKSGKLNEMVVVTGISSQAQQSIFNALCEQGFVFGRDFVDLTTWQVDHGHFFEEVVEILGHSVSRNRFFAARAYNYTTAIGTDTSIGGNFLLSEIIATTAKLGGQIAEIGAFKGGNAFFQLQQMLIVGDQRPYTIIDSFGGFAEMSEKDPKHLQNHYDNLHQKDVTEGIAHLFPNASVFSGYVPQVLQNFKPSTTFSVVFFDCDLYQPALDTLEFFWPHLLPGGYMVLHDYHAANDSWTGVRKAVDEFADIHSCKVQSQWATTMAVLQK